jgi:transglutaminase-like putative cysteine protease
VAEVAGEIGSGLPEPESDDLGRYLEDTITIDWQAPAIMKLCSDLLSGQETAEERVGALFEYVRDEITHSIDAGAEIATCNASQVLREGTGLCYAKSHLLAALLRVAGYPTGFCYARLATSDRPDRMSLHGFNAVYWKLTESWIYLDARGNREGLSTEVRFASPWSLAYAPDTDRGESFLPFIYRRPGKRVVALLERAPDFAAVCRNLPDAL